MSQTPTSSGGGAAKSTPAPHPRTAGPEVGAELEPNPESRLRHDPYINDKFIDIFRHEDNDGALAHVFEKNLSANDDSDGTGTAPRTNGFMAWLRTAREEKE